jgi:iron complex outermembrane receptor protein
VIDIYDIDYAALSDYGGGLPPGVSPADDTSQTQLGLYVQDQIRIQDRVSIVLGARHDNVTTTAHLAGTVDKAHATTLRAGIIGELVKGVSPFFSYTQSFDPISGTASDGNPFKPKRGRQFEAGVKFHPDDKTLVTVTAFHIRENNRPIDDPTPGNPFGQRQAGLLTSKGFEFEGSRMLPGNFELIANYGYTWIQESGTGHQLYDVAKHNASVWTTKTFPMNDTTSLRLGGGVRYSSGHQSNAVYTPGYTLVDALAEITHGPWSLSVNANNLLGTQFYAACLNVGRGDCFMGADRNVFGTVSYRF